jgi:hypothetical protein
MMSYVCRPGSSIHTVPPTLATFVHRPDYIRADDSAMWGVLPCLTAASSSDQTQLA